MEKRRVLVFFVSSMAVLFVWMNFVAPKFFPPPPRPAQNEPAAEAEGDKPAQPNDPDAPLVAGKPDEAAPGEVAPLVEPAPEAPIADEPESEPRTVMLGSMDPEHGYFLSVEITNRGAAVKSITLNDPRFPSVDDPTQQLQILGSTEGIPSTFASTFANKELTTTEYLDPSRFTNWSVATGDADGKELLEFDERHSEIVRSVTFRKTLPELGIEVFKTYRLHASEQIGDALVESRKAYAAGYELKLELTVRNLGNQPRRFHYLLQGPTGLPLEDKVNARVFRTVKVGYADGSGAIDLETLTATDLQSAVDADEAPTQFGPGFRFAGLDVQYFSALVIPTNDEKSKQSIASVMPLLLERDAADKNLSDISFFMQSRAFDLLPKGKNLEDGTPGDSITETLTLFAGPKREELLIAYDASSLLDYGTFGALAGWMLIVLNFLHDAGLTYGIAIIGLTVLVRLLMFPLTRKQAVGAQKMKELQPKLNEIKKKYAKEKEKLARAQMELFRKHNYNPLAGCLPMLLQLPIFISLYTALSTSVELRMTPFLWFDNLAAPDALFPLPFKLPFLGNKFNLLPIFTIVLFIVQQKMFMPPAADPEQAAQFKMMNIMMIFMGFLFYKVPAGLCIYFIASSLWGIGERKLLDRWKAKQAEESNQIVVT